MNQLIKKGDKVHLCGIVLDCELKYGNDEYSFPAPNIDRKTAYLMIGLSTKDGEYWFYTPKLRFNINHFPIKTNQFPYGDNAWINARLEPKILQGDNIEIKGTIDWAKSKHGPKLKCVKLISVIQQNVI